MKNKFFNQKGKYHCYIYFIIVGLLLGSFFGSIVSHVAGAETYNLILIEDSSDYAKYGFKDLGVYYTNNELVSFDMPFIVSKGSFVLSDRDLSSSVVGSVKDKSVLTARSPSYSYKILAENDKYYVINYHMDIKASNKTFSVDLIPSIKGVSIPKYAWWNSSWLYYKTLNIANKCLGCPIRISIGNSSTGNVSCGGHIKQGNYFQDVRFVVSNTTMLYHWMENVTTNVNAVFWINNSLNSSQILLYYGNSACGNTSYRNGTKTFLFFDDFIGSAVDWTNKWQSTDHTKYAVSAGILTMSVPVATTAMIETKLAYTNFFAKIRINPVTAHPADGARHLIFWDFHAVSTSLDVKDDLYIDMDDTAYHAIVINGVEIKSNTVAVTWWKAVFKCPSVGNSEGFWYYDNTGVVKLTKLAVPASTTSYMGILVWVASSGKVDWVFIGKYNTQYWSSFGGETTNSPPSLSLVFPVNNSVGVDFTPVCSVWCNDTDTTLLTVTWQTNNSGAYVTRQVNSSFAANSICRYHFTWAVVNSTKYWFRVYVYDGVTNVTRWYCFTVKVNYTLSANIDFVILFPVNNSRDICPCCIVFGVNVSNNVSENMTLTFSNNDTGDFEVLSNLQNGTYYFTYCGFNLFGETYDWWLTIDSDTNSTTSGYQHFYVTSNIDCGDVDISNIYTKPESDDLFLGAILNIEPNLLFLGIVLSLWLYFVTKYFDKKEVIFAEIQFGLSMPLTLALAVFSFNYPLGIILVMLIPVFAIWILVSGFFYNKRQKEKR